VAARRGGGRSGLARLREEIAERGATSLTDLARLHRVRLRRHRRFVAAYANDIMVESIALEAADHEAGGGRVVVEGRAIFEGEPARVWVEAAERGRRRALTAVFHGLAAPAGAMLKRLAAPSYDDEVDRLDLSETRLVFATAETAVAAGDAPIPIRAGVTFLAALRLPPAIDRLVGGPGGDRTLTLSGPVPEEAAADLRFETAPRLTLHAGAFTLDELRVEVVTRTAPPRAGGVRETRARLCGGAAALPRVLLAAPIPEGGGLLQLALASRRGVAVPSLAALDPLLDGAPAWRDAIGGDLGAGVDLRLVEYARDVAPATGKAASARLSVAQKDAVLALERGASLSFPSLTLRCVEGFPDDPAQRGVFVEAEGDAFLVAGERRVLGRPLDTTVTFAPERAVHAVIERLTPAEARRLARALDLHPAPASDERPHPPWTGTLAITTGSARLTAFDDAERSLIWER
jgi:hypothetical protein